MRAVGRVDLELERAAAVGQRLPARAADGVAGLRATADEINLAGDVFDLHVGEAGRLARADAADDDELLRLAPVRRLPRLRDGEHAPEVVALPQVVNREVGRLKLVALDEHPGGDEEGRGGDLDAVVRGASARRLLPLERDGGRAAFARGDLFEVVRRDGRGRGEESLLLRDAALLVDRDVVAAVHRRHLPVARAGLDRALRDADGLGLVLADVEARVRLRRDAALGQARADDVLRALGLLVCADVDLAALDRDANLRALAVLRRRVLGDGDDRVRLHKKVRAVGERDARAPVLLRLDDVAGQEARVGAGLQSLARVGSDDPHAAFERDEARARRTAHVGRDALERVAVEPNVEAGPARDDRERDDNDGHVDEALLDDPPLHVVAADSCDHSFGLSA